MISLLAFLACLALMIINWITLLLALIVVLQVIVRGIQVRQPVDLETFVCDYLYHPLVARLERHLQWVKWPRRRRGLAWLTFFTLINAVLITTHSLSSAIQAR